MNNFVELEEFPGYFINRKGVVIGPKGHPLTHSPNVDGYPVVYMRREGKNCCVRVHRQLAKTFIPNPDDLPVVNHIDGDKTNHKLDNLEWTTVQGNVIHAIDVLGIDTKCAALISKELVHTICQDLENGIKQKDIYNKYGVSQSIVSRIRTGKTWPDISAQYNINARTRRLKVDTILEICRQLNSGKTNTEIVQNIDDTEVTPSTVSKISNFKTYEDITANILRSKEERSSTRAKARSLK